jgi:arogenate dehydrogenase (NADP+)
MGLELRRQGYRVIGVSRQAATCKRAIARGAVDEAGCELERLAAADVVVLCPPIGLVGAIAAQVIPHLQPTAILTDVASVKGAIVADLAPQWPRFVGGHPMAGTHESGIEAAQFDLFQGCPYVITPTETTDRAAIAIVTALAKALGSVVYECTPTAHDRAVAWISHLPVFVSASLIAACAGEDDPAILTLAQQLASSGFRDTSRVGGGNPELGTMMARHNRAELLRSLATYRDTLNDLINQVNIEDWDGITETLTETQAGRSPFVDPPA